MREVYDFFSRAGKVSESSWKIMGPSSSMLQARAQPSLSPFQLQQQYLGSLDDRHRSVGSSLGTTSVEPLVYLAGQQQSLVSTHDVVAGTQKASVSLPLATVLSQNAPIAPATVASSPGIPRQQSYNIGFKCSSSMMQSSGS